MAVPLFSVVIPTRNRPAYLGDAITSVLLQDFADMECIVSDNFSEPGTRAVVQSFEPNARLRYVRPPEPLSMLDHWEFASIQAKGEIVIMLADRKVLCQGALRTLHSSLSHHPRINTFTFGTQVFDDEHGRMGWGAGRRRTQLNSSADLVGNFLRASLFTAATLDTLFPKSHNGGYRQILATRARSVTGRYFNNVGVTTPDFSSFFATCALENTVLHVGERLMLTQGEHTSNGRLFGVGNTSGYMGHFPDTLYDVVPFKEPFIYNLLMADYLRIRAAFGGNLAAQEVDWVSYFRNLRVEYWMKEAAAFLPRAELDRLHHAWQMACGAKLGRGAAEEIDAQIARGDEEKTRLDVLAHLRDFVNHRFSRFSFVNRITRHRFDGVLEAAGFSKRDREPFGSGADGEFRL